MRSRALSNNLKLAYTYQALTAGLFFLPIWVTYQAKFLSVPQMAFFNAMFFLMILAFELPTGVFADMFGRKTSMIMGSISNALAFIVIAVFPSLPGMWVHIFLNGLGAALISGANTSLLYDSLKEANQEKQFPIVWAKAALAFQIMGAITILSGGYLFKFHETLPYLLRALFFVLSIIPALMLVEPKLDSTKFTLTSYIKHTITGAKLAFRSVKLAKLSVIYILVWGVATSNQRFFIQLFMQENGLGEIDRSWIAFAVKILISVLALWLAKRKKLFHSKYFVLLLPIVMLLSLLPAKFITMPLLLIVIIGIAFPSGAVKIFLTYPIHRELESKYRATSMSTLSMFASLVYAVNNLIGGFISEKTSVGQFYLIMGLFTLIVIIPLALSAIFEDE